MSRWFAIAAIALLAVLAVLGVATHTAQDQAARAPATPSAATVDGDPLRAGFLPLLQRALATVDTLVAMGESRERNLLVIHARQSAMLDALAAADAWLGANPASANAPAVTAYQEGAREIRAAMEQARAGLLRLDFGEVARATTTMKQGAAALRRAAALIGGEPVPGATPAGAPLS